MEDVLEGLDGFVCAYMDDLIIYSDSWEDHVQHVRLVLEALRKAGPTANPSKCRWGGEQIEFLGHLIGKGVNSVPDHRSKAIAAYTKPSTKKGMRAFLGMVSYYRKFMKRLAEQTAVSSPATSKAAPNKVVWSGDMEDAFVVIRKSICVACILTIPLPEDTFSLVTDASGRGIGGVLQVY